ncbi:hypothetical protein EYF80_064500 [Liparis tanakae]|uniref:Uncharacterized protein n=1 Tax=Liparis tanakae TaxID=230148 RepID=A0A4Z2EAT7_9TELE|nr:hypothetical protein EYF80_064500 [Liparis tanakae]
MGSGGAVL